LKATQFSSHLSLRTSSTVFAHSSSNLSAMFTHRW
jgi:hypothetical protein